MFNCHQKCRYNHCIQTHKTPHFHCLGKNFIVDPACGEQSIVVTTSVRCMFVRHACVHPSGFVRATTSAFMHRFQNNLAQLFSLRSRSAI